jgi:hypothetical protein
MPVNDEGIFAGGICSITVTGGQMLKVLFDLG